MKVIRFWEDTTHPITGLKVLRSTESAVKLNRQRIKRNYELHAEYSDMFLT